MQRLFGGRGGKEPAAHSRSPDVLAQIAESKELIAKREEHLTRKVKQEVAEAMAHKEAGRKEHALAALKRKKLIDDELAGLLQQRLKLDATEHTLQSLKFHEKTQQVERAAAAAIKTEIARAGGASRAEETREATEEALEDAYEMLRVASEPTAVPGLSGVEDDELMAELLELEEAEERQKLAAKLTKVDLPVSSEASTGPGELPAAPTGPVVSQLNEEEARELAELDALAASMVLERPMAMPMAGLTVQVA